LAVTPKSARNTHVCWYFTLAAQNLEREATLVFQAKGIDFP
jgi:hypothetical protein